MVVVPWEAGVSRWGEGNGLGIMEKTELKKI